MTCVDIQMNYDEIPLPRQNDRLLIDVFDSVDLTEEEMASLCRVRCSLKALFLSDIVTADGKKLEHFATDALHKGSVTSTYLFPRECPDERDWEIWKEFWSQQTDTGAVLINRLGDWVHPSHRVWEWFIDTESGELQR